MMRVLLHNSVQCFLTNRGPTSDAGADPNIIMNQDLTAMDLVSVEDSDRESAVKFYKLKYQVSFDAEDIKSAHPLIMDILNK
jgi:hypothetical protein